MVVVGTSTARTVGEHVRKRLGEGAIAVQDPPLGTGHAVLAAKTALAGFEGDVVVTYADCPLLSAATIEPLFDLRDTGADLAVLGFEAADPAAYGRLIHLGIDGDLHRIVEAKDATDHEKAIRACNSGVMAADAALLFDLLGRVGNNNSKGEYYLTDVIGLAVADGLSAQAKPSPRKRRSWASIRRASWPRPRPPSRRAGDAS